MFFSPQGRKVAKFYTGALKVNITESMVSPLVPIFYHQQTSNAWDAGPDV